MLSTLVALPNSSLDFLYIYVSENFKIHKLQVLTNRSFLLRTKSFGLQIITSRLSAINPKYRIPHFTPCNLGCPPSPFPLHLSRSRASINGGHPKVTTDTEWTVVQSCGVKANHPLDEAEGVRVSVFSVSFPGR